jgi:hypothetical protein
LLVHQDDIGPQTGDFDKGAFAGFHRRDDVDVLIERQKFPQPGSEQRMVVDE